MDIQQMNYDVLRQISETLITIANNQAVLRDELQSIDSSIQNISQSGIYDLKDVCDKLDPLDFQLTLIDGSITSIT